MVLIQSPLSEKKLGRREILWGVLASWVILAASTTVASAASILSEQSVESLVSRGLDKQENMNRLRRLIENELRDAYRNNPRAGFPSYNANRIDRDDVFFGNVRGNVSNQIQYDNRFGTTYDNRIKWVIHFSTPEHILWSIGGQRFPELERSWNIAFIMKDQYGVDIFAYYEHGKLKYLLPTTTGSRSTPDNMIVRWWYHREKAIHYNDRELANYYHLQSSGKKWPMPYSRRLSTIDRNGQIHYEWINAHIWNVSPNESSHGCARQWALGAALLYHTMQADTVVYYRPHIYLPPES